MNNLVTPSRFIVATLTLALSAFSLVGCGESSDSTGSAGGGGSSKPRIALVMKSLANEFFSTMAKGAEKHQAAHADDYELIVNGIKDETDLSAQVSLVEQMMAQQVDAIVIAPADSKALVPVLQRAQHQGIVVINIDNKLDEGVLAITGIRIPFVGPDNKAGARKVGEHLAKSLQAGDKVVVLEGVQTAFNSQQRTAGFSEAMEEVGIEIVDSQSARWETSVANQVASAMLTAHPDIKAILACNDSMALGALAAVKAAGRTDDVQVVGFDNISAVQQAIKDGEVLATADQHGDQLAVFGIEYALESLKDDVAALKDKETPVDLVTAKSL